HQFAHLSDRLTMKDGVTLISAASFLTLLYTRGETSTLVLMYSINVFLTFSLSETSMVRYWIRSRKRHTDWYRHITIHVIGLVLSVWSMAGSVLGEFREGGWVPLSVTGALVGLCFWINRASASVRGALEGLDDLRGALPGEAKNPPGTLAPTAPTAVLLVGH